MFSKRYTIIVADRATGAVRRITVSVRAALFAVVGIMALPVLMGLGARLSATADIERLRARADALDTENSSYRAATGELTMQLSALQDVLDELGERARADEATAVAMSKLPTVVRQRAMGGSAAAAEQTSRTLLAAAVSSPENTFGVLRDLLGVLENRLRVVRSDVERWEALAGATPSIWPAYGWLTDRFGKRRDPFTGEQAYHLGLDISADKGAPVFATAAGVVQSAGWHNDFGNLVVIGHDFGLLTRYAHLSRMAVKAGEQVRRGDIIGYVGATGRATGTHLHYEVWANGRPINPLELLTTKRP
jgi:murein DD-endopeptidase MepM/ murein hydrolase activator NlpD